MSSITNVTVGKANRLLTNLRSMQDLLEQIDDDWRDISKDAKNSGVQLQNGDLLNSTIDALYRIWESNRPPLTAQGVVSHVNELAQSRTSQSTSVRSKMFRLRSK